MTVGPLTIDDRAKGSVARRPPAAPQSERVCALAFALSRTRCCVRYRDDQQNRLAGEGRCDSRRCEIVYLFTADQAGAGEQEGGNSRTLYRKRARFWLPHTPEVREDCSSRQQNIGLALEQGNAGASLLNLGRATRLADSCREG